MHDSANTTRPTLFQGVQFKTSEGKSVVRWSEFVLVVMKAQSHEGGGRILLGNYRGGGAVTLRLIKFQCVGVWISNCLPR